MQRSIAALPSAVSSEPQAGWMSGKNIQVFALSIPGVYPAINSFIRSSTVKDEMLAIVSKHSMF